MANDMLICPIQRECSEATNGEFYYTTTECIEADCAWWDKEQKCCSELSKLKKLEDIRKAILTPHPR